MSFFGFDTNLPGKESHGGGGLSAGAKEDVEIYTWGADDYDKLADQLIEDNDDLNDDTFGFDEVSKDFDFAGNTASFFGGPAATPAAPSQSTAPSGASAFATSMSDFWSDPLLGPASSSGFGRQGSPFTGDAATRSAPTAQQAFHSSPFAQSLGGAPQASPQQQNNRPAPRTLEEVEAELRAKSQSRAPPPHMQQAPQLAASGPSRRPLTLEEVEAQMLAQRASQPPPVASQDIQAQSPAPPAQASLMHPSMHTAPPGPAPQLEQPGPALPNSTAPAPYIPDLNQYPALGTAPPTGPSAGRNVHDMLMQAQNSPRMGGPSPTLPGPLGQLRGGPPSGSMAHSPSNSGIPPHLITGGMGGRGGTPPLISSSGPLPAPSTIAAAQAAAAHRERMRALLESIPHVLQNRILSFPPNVQFEALGSVLKAAPALLELGPAPVPKGEEDAQRIIDLLNRAHDALNEVERMIMKRIKREGKIAAMSHYNNLMSNSDKEFITRIQVSQIVTSDPYADDFYAHIFFALRGGNKVGTPPTASAPPKADVKENGEPAIPTGPAKDRNKKKKVLPSRRESAMVRMQTQVERIVANRKARDEKEREAGGSHALGKVSAASTKNMRQMLQLGDDAAAAAREHVAKKLGGALTNQQNDAVRNALADANLEQSGSTQRKPALTRFEALRILEKLYDTVMAIEQGRRNAPPEPAADESADKDAAGPEAQSEGAKAYALWQSQQHVLTTTLWQELRVLEPLEISDPHPFVSLLSTAKGKRLLPRALRLLTSEQNLTALTMVVASFDRLDVVRSAVELDKTPTPKNTAGRDRLRQARAELERQTEAFSAFVVPQLMTLMSTAPMRLVCGMLALFFDRNDVHVVARTRPGIALLTIFLSRAETLKQADTAGEVTPAPTADELAQWTQIFGLLFARLSTTSPSEPPFAGQATPLAQLFPSTRARAALPFGAAPSAVSYYASAVGSGIDEEAADEPVWNLLAALALGANMDQQHALVQQLRDKILENVLAAKLAAQHLNGDANAEGLPQDRRIANVNLLLHALNLDASQISA